MLKKLATALVLAALTVFASLLAQDADSDSRENLTYIVATNAGGGYERTENRGVFFF